MRTHLPAMLAACLLAGPALAQGGAGGSPALDPTAFYNCVQGLKSDAYGRGIPANVVERAFTGLQPDPKVLELDRRQPEFVLSFWRYIEKTVSADRVANGQAMLARHRPLLEQMRGRYGVPPEVLVAFWGIETNYGTIMGDFVLTRALSTLACDDRRAKFFANEMMEALRMLAEDRIDPATTRGSWAGAFGNMQFMPSNFTRYAIDEDGDGKRDLFSSMPDAFASAGNFLSQIGWRAGEPIAEEVTLPASFPWEQADPTIEKTAAEWAALGLRHADGRPLQPSERKAAIALPAGHRGPAFLLHPNYNAVLRWNRSTLYALAVSILADRIAGRPGMTAMQIYDEPPLSYADVIEMQVALGRLGLYPGQPDGLIGPQTRAAIRAFQQSRNMPADGYPAAELVQQIRGAP